MNTILRATWPTELPRSPFVSAYTLTGRMLGRESVTKKSTFLVPVSPSRTLTFDADSFGSSTAGADVPTPGRENDRSLRSTVPLATRSVRSSTARTSLRSIPFSDAIGTGRSGAGSSA